MLSTPVGIAYAIWSGVGIVLISAVGWLAYDQKLDAPAVAGISLIICGVIVAFQCAVAFEKTLSTITPQMISEMPATAGASSFWFADHLRSDRAQRLLEGDRALKSFRFCFSDG
jgi:hypothetical protein